MGFAEYPTKTKTETYFQASYAALRIIQSMSKPSPGRRLYQHPCANPGICGAAVTGFFQIVLGCGSIAAGVVLILEDNDILPIGFAIWGGGVVSSFFFK